MTKCFQKAKTSMIMKLRMPCFKMQGILLKAGTKHTQRKRALNTVHYDYETRSHLIHQYFGMFNI